MTKIFKRAFLTSALAILLCVVMLIGNTFAWFTDTATTGTNTITSGNLDVGLEYSYDMSSWANAEGDVTIFDPDAEWEPGYAEVVYFKVENLGSLAFNYKIGTIIRDVTIGKNKDGGDIDLTAALKFGIVETNVAFATRNDALDAIASPLNFSDLYYVEKSLDANGDSATYAIIVWLPTDVDNTFNHDGVNVPSVDFGIQVIASQKVLENDSFGPDYDSGATYPYIPESVYLKETETIAVEANTAPENDLVITGNGVVVTVPKENYVVDTAQELVTEIEVTLVEGDTTSAEYEIDIKIINANGENIILVTPAVIEVDLATELENVKVKHNGSDMIAVTSYAELDADQEYYYDAATGKLTILSATFSPFEVTFDERFDDLMANWTADCKLCSASNPHKITSISDLNKIREHKNTASNVVDGYFVLVNDIAFTAADFAEGGEFYNGGEGWLAIGHNNIGGAYGSNNGISFNGTFDGNGKTISGIITNRPSNYKKYNGLFAFLAGDAHVFDLTLKDCSIKGDMSGVLTGMVNSQNAIVENITIDNCKLTTVGLTNMASGILIGKLQGGTVQNVLIKDSTYGGGSWGCGYIAGLIQNSVLKGITVDNCNATSWTHNGMLTSSIQGTFVQMSDITIKGTFTQSHSDAFYYLAETFSVSDISQSFIKNVDIQLNVDGTAYTAPNKGLFSGTPAAIIPMENVNLSIAYNTANGSGDMAAQIEKNVIYVLDSTLEKDKPAGAKMIIAYVNGGAFADGTVFAENVLATPIKDGYTFGGWYTSADFAGEAATSFDIGTTYYAKWN